MVAARKFWICVLVLWTFTVTILRGIGTPNDFAEAHWLIDYRFGFVKRGFVGAAIAQLAGPLSVELTPQLIAVLSVVVFASYCLVLAWLSMRIIIRAGWRGAAVLVPLVFLSSPFIVMSAHLQGYFDHIVVILGALSVLCMQRARPWAGAALQALAVLVHENAMVLVFPMFCLAWLLSNSRRQQHGATLLSWLPLCLPLLALLAVALSQSLLLDDDFVPKMTNHLAQYAFLGPERFMDVPVWLATSFGSFLAQEGAQFVTRLTSTEMLSLMLPGLLAIVVATVFTYRIVDISLESLTVIGICLTPLLMHAIAWDTARIWTYVLLCAFLTYWVYAEHVEPSGEYLRGAAAVTVLCLIALLLHVVLVTPLMDGKSDHFGLRKRLALYAPMLLGTVLLLLRGSGAGLAARLAVQGTRVGKLLGLR